MSAYLVIDIGTSSAKAAIYQEDGRKRSSFSMTYAVNYPRLGWAEQNPQDWWTATQHLCQEILQETRAEDINCISVSGQAPSCVAIDCKGNPIRPAILWLDRRAQPQVDWLRQHIGEDVVENRCSNTIDSYYGGVKWLWFLQNEPDLYQKTWKIMQANGFVVYKLTGAAVTDPSHAGMCTPCFNLSKQEWDEELCEQMGIDMHKLPATQPSSEIVGQVTHQAAAATGLKIGTPVVCGGGDFACACLGAGAVGKGSAAMMLGTAGNLLVPGMRQTDPRLINTVHLTGEGLSLGGVFAGGSVQWFGDMLGISQPDLFALLDAEAAKTPPGADGLIFLPYLMGERTPIWDAQARGVFIGLVSSHRRGHLFRAVLEGVAYAYRQMLEILAEKGSAVHEVVAINGGARSPLWRQIFADVLQVPIRWRPESGGTLAGAAYLAALGAGNRSSFEDMAAWLEPTIDTTPTSAWQDHYLRQYEIFCQLYGRLQDLFPRLNRS